MAPTATEPKAPAARTAVAPTPKALQRKLTLTKAIEQYVETTLAMEGLAPLQKEAKAFIIAHGERTGRRTFKDLIAMERTGGSLVLDQAAAVELILATGRKLRAFQKTTKLGWTLKILR